eukprot:6103935-Pyramimonas_sp.AAC.1
MQALLVVWGPVVGIVSVLPDPGESDLVSHLRARFRKCAAWSRGLRSTPANKPSRIAFIPAVAVGSVPGPTVMLSSLCAVRTGCASSVHALYWLAQL